MTAQERVPSAGLVLGWTQRACWLNHGGRGGHGWCHGGGGAISARCVAIVALRVDERRAAYPEHHCTKKYGESPSPFRTKACPFGTHPNICAVHDAHEQRASCVFRTKRTTRLYEAHASSSEDVLFRLCFVQNFQLVSEY